MCVPKKKQLATLSHEEQDRAAFELRTKQGMVATQKSFEQNLIARQHDETWVPGKESKKGYKNITQRLQEQAEELTRTYMPELSS